MVLILVGEICGCSNKPYKYSIIGDLKIKSGAWGPGFIKLRKNVVDRWTTASNTYSVNNNNDMSDIRSQVEYAIESFWDGKMYKKQAYDTYVNVDAAQLDRFLLALLLRSL